MLNQINTQNYDKFKIINLIIIFNKRTILKCQNIIIQKWYKIKINKIIKINHFSIIKSLLMNLTQIMKPIKNKQQLQNRNNPSSFNQNVIITNVQIKNNQLNIQQSHPKRQISQFFARQAIKLIIKNFQQKIFEINCIQNKLNPYGSNFALNYIQQTISLQSSSRKILKPFSQQFQPMALKTDNLIPIGTNLEQRQTDKLSVKQSSPDTERRIPRNSSIVSRISKQVSMNPSDAKKTPKVYEYVKLNEQDLPKIQVSFDPFIEQLRKQKQTNSKQNQQKKPQKKNSVRDIIKKDQKISYDFNGQLIKIKPNQKGNFIANAVQGAQNASLTKKQKQPKIDINPINLDINSKKGQQKKAISKKAMDIQFSNIISLTPQLQIHQGVKFMHGKSVMQKKKKQASITQLKKTISNKRITRNDFQRLKSVGDSKSIRQSSIKQKGQTPSLPTILKSQTDINADKNSSILGRSVSEAKFQDKSRFSVKNKYLFTDRSHDKVSIENQQLTQMLVEPVFNTLEDAAILRLPTADNQQISKIQALSPMDKANLNFIKTGSVGKLQLPKISYRITNNQLSSKGPHPITLLQSKMKLKGKRKQNQFERIRKHFQDKLRT